MQRKLLQIQDPRCKMRSLRSYLLRLTFLFLLFTIHCSLFTVVHAAPLTDESVLDIGINKAPQVVTDGPTFFASIVKLFSGLAVVIGVMLVIYYFVRERLGRINKASSKGKLINVIATHYLSPKKSIMLIEVAGELLVVGVGEEINLLARMGDITNEDHGPDFSDAMKSAIESEGPLGVVDSIKGRLESLMGKR